MRVFGSAVFGTILFLSAAASAADLKVKVVDPQSAAVAGVQVSLMRFNESKALAVQTTSAEGAATFRLPGSGPYQIQVLAPGFASETVDVSSKTEITVALHVAIAAETVVVSATRTPVPGEAAGADVDTLSRSATHHHATNRGQRCHALSSRRRHQHLGTTRWSFFAIRPRRRIQLQQSHRRRRHQSTSPAAPLTSARSRWRRAIAWNSFAARKALSMEPMP